MAQGLKVAGGADGVDVFQQWSGELTAAPAQCLVPRDQAPELGLVLGEQRDLAIEQRGVAADGTAESDTARVQADHIEVLPGGSGEHVRPEGFGAHELRPGTAGAARVEEQATDRMRAARAEPVHRDGCLRSEWVRVVHRHLDGSTLELRR
ncbi:hypothetical protein ACQ4WX_06425 [Streptomyces lasalocidi]